MLSNIQQQQFIYNRNYSEASMSFMDVRGNPTYIGSMQGSANHATYSNNKTNYNDTEQRYKPQQYNGPLNNEGWLSSNETDLGNRYMIPATQHRTVNTEYVYSYPSSIYKNNRLVSVRSMSGNHNKPIYNAHGSKSSVNNTTLERGTSCPHIIPVANNLPAPPTFQHRPSSIQVHTNSNNNTTSHHLQCQNVSNPTTAAIGMYVGKDFPLRPPHRPYNVPRTGNNLEVSNNSLCYHLADQGKIPNKHHPTDLILTPPPTPLLSNQVPQDQYTIEMFKNEVSSSKLQLSNLQQLEDGTVCFLQPSNKLLRLQTNNTETSIVPDYKKLLHTMTKNATYSPSIHITISNKKSAMAPLKLRMKQSRKSSNEVICISDSDEESGVTKERNKEMIDGMCTRKPTILNGVNCHSASHRSNIFNQNVNVVDVMKHTTPHMTKYRNGMLQSSSNANNENPAANMTSRNQEYSSDNNQAKRVAQSIYQQVCKTAQTTNLHDTLNQTRIDTHLCTTHKTLSNCYNPKSDTNVIQNVHHRVPPQGTSKSCDKNIPPKPTATNSTCDLRYPKSILTPPENCTMNSNDNGDRFISSKQSPTTETFTSHSIHPKKIYLKRNAAQLEDAHKTESLRKESSQPNAECCGIGKSLLKFQKLISPITFTKTNKNQSIFETLENEWNLSDEKVKSVFKRGRKKFKLQEDDKGTESSKAGVINQLPLLNTLIKTGKKDMQKMDSKNCEEKQDKLVIYNCPTEQNSKSSNALSKSNYHGNNEVYVSSFLLPTPSSFLYTIKSIVVGITAPLVENRRKNLDPVEQLEEALGESSQMFHCDFSGCNYSSVNESHCDKHYLGHSNDKEFKCPICSFGYTKLWRVHAHMNTVHGISKENLLNEGRRRKDMHKEGEKIQAKEGTPIIYGDDILEDKKNCKITNVRKHIPINEYLDCFDQLLSEDDEFDF